MWLFYNDRNYFIMTFFSIWIILKNINDRNDCAEVGHKLFKIVLQIKIMPVHKEAILIKGSILYPAFRKWLGNALEFRLPSFSVSGKYVMSYPCLYILLWHTDNHNMRIIIWVKYVFHFITSLFSKF